MRFSRPASFEEAVGYLRQQRLLPTSLSAADLAKLDATVRVRGIFSARTTMGEHLQVIRDQTLAMADGGTDLATAKLELKKSLQRLGYRPAEEDKGTLKDLSSERRRDLVVRMNARFAQGFGQWKQGQDPAFLAAWPCKEIVREQARKEPRGLAWWQARFVEAGGTLYDGRMIARKDSPVWRKLSRFKLPYPPYDYGSGMGDEDVSAAEAIELGVITPDDVIEPDTTELNDGLEARPQITDPELREAVRRDLGDAFRWVDGVLKAA